MRRFSKRLLSSGIIDIVAGAIPGIRDILVLGKVKQIEQQGVADLILVDAPATGHTMTFLSSAGGLLDAARGGPIRAQAADVVALLSDPARCQVALVTLPEEMPVNEVVEAAYQLEDRVGIALGPLIVNACLPRGARTRRTGGGHGRPRAGVDLAPDLSASLEEARRFRQRRRELQEEQVAAARRGAAPPPDAGPLPLCRRDRAAASWTPSASPRPGIEALHEPDPGGPVTDPARAGPVAGRLRPPSVRSSAEPVDRHLLRLGRSGEDDHFGGHRPARPPASAAPPAWSPSTRPDGWPTPSAWTSCRTARPASPGTGPGSSTPSCSTPRAPSTTSSPATRTPSPRPTTSGSTGSTAT